MKKFSLIFFILFLFIGNTFAEKGLNFFIEPVSSHTEILAKTTFEDIYEADDIEDFLKLKTFSFGLENLIKYSSNSYFTSTYKVDVFYNSGDVIGFTSDDYIAITDCEGFGFTYSIGTIFTKNFGDYFKLGIQPSIGIGYDYIKSKGDFYHDYNSFKYGSGRKYNQINSMLFGELGVTPLFMVGNDKFKIEFGWSFVFKPYWCYYKARASKTENFKQYKKAENVADYYFYNTAKLGLIFSY